jgi:hypothetical protein
MRRLVSYVKQFPCSEASCHSSGCESRRHRSPVDVVVISSNGEGDRSVESLEVKAPEGWASQSDPYRGASNLAGRSGSEPVKPRNFTPAWNGFAGLSGVPSRWEFGEGHVGVEILEHIDVELPGVVEDGMSGRNGQRKPGTTRGSPRRSRTAKTSRISRGAVKSRCARERGGWGRLSVDGPGQHNPASSEDPWGRWINPPHGGAVSRQPTRL